LPQARQQERGGLVGIGLFHYQFKKDSNLSLESRENLTILMGILDDHHPPTVVLFEKNPGVADVKAFARELSEKAMSQCRDFMEKRSNEVKEMGVTALWGFLGAEILLKEETEKNQEKG